MRTYYPDPKKPGVGTVVWRDRIMCFGGSYTGPLYTTTIPWWDPANPLCSTLTDTRPLNLDEALERWDMKITF